MSYSLNIHGQLFSLDTPQVMGIINATPDSFYTASRQQSEAALCDRLCQIMAEGGTLVDVGACSTRPGAPLPSEQEEIARLRKALTTLRDAIDRLECAPPVLSVDTFRPDVARMAVEEFGADIINDVSEGSEAMFRMVARLSRPYILTSTQPDLRSTLLIDPGFGFGKTLKQNYALLNELDRLLVMELPLLVGISRKSMIYKKLNCTPEEALNGTTALNTVALMKGASILRVHDVRQACECCQLIESLK